MVNGNKDLLRFSGTFLVVGLLCLSVSSPAEAEEAVAETALVVVENQMFEGIIEPIVVTADSCDLDMTLESRVDRKLLWLDPSSFNHDIFMHLQRSPLITSGLFSSRISINGNRPEDTCIEIDRVLRVYDWGKVQNVFAVFDPVVFDAKLQRFGYQANGESGFSRIELSTNPRRESGLALRFFDLAASTNYSPLSSELFALAKISWLDQIINRIFGDGFVCPHNQEFYSKMSLGPRRFRVDSNFWWFREGAYIRTGAVTDGDMRKSYQTEADWLSEKEFMAFWINNRMLLSSKVFLELAFSVYDAHRLDDATGKSGLAGIVKPTDLFIDLSFATRSLSSLAELSYFGSHWELFSGVRVSSIANRFSFHSDGYYYPGFYRSQRGDEISPEELKSGVTREDAFETTSWAHVSKELLGLQVLAGLVGSHRTGYPFGLSPRIQIGYPLAISFLEDPRLIFSAGKYRQFPGPERVYVTMYPLSESKGKVEESYLLALGLRSDQLTFSLYASKARDLYLPGDENARFGSAYADGYTAGLEMGINGRLGGMITKIDYGYGTSINRQEGVPYRSLYDPGHNALLSLIYQPTKRISLSATTQFGQGQRIDRLLGREETPQGYIPIWDPIPNSDRLPPKLTISMGSTLSLTEKLLLSLYVVNFPGYTCAVFYEGWDPSKKSYVKYPFVVGLGTELSF